MAGIVAAGNGWHQVPIDMLELFFRPLCNFSSEKDLIRKPLTLALAAEHSPYCISAYQVTSSNFLSFSSQTWLSLAITFTWKNIFTEINIDILAGRLVKDRCKLVLCV